LRVFKNPLSTILTYRDKVFALSLYMLSSIVPMGLSLLINPFLAANLSPDDYAIIGYFTSFNILLLPLIGFSLVNYYTRNYFLVDEAQRVRILNTLISALLIFGPLVFVLFLTGLYFYAEYIHLTFSFYPFALISLIPTYFTLFYSFYLNEKKMEGNARGYFRIAMVNAILLTGFSLMLVVAFKFGATGRLMAITCSALGIGLYSLNRMRIRIHMDWKILSEALRFCWPITLSAVLYFFLSGIDKLFLERLNDHIELGYYNVAFQISAYTGFLGTALITTFDPDIYKAIAQNDERKLIRIFLIITIPCILANLTFIAVAKPLISLLTFGRYVPSTGYARILALRNITTPVYFVISGIIIGYGFPKVDMVNRIIGAVLSIMLFKWLITRYGFYGACWGQVGSMLLMSFIDGTFILFLRTDRVKNWLKPGNRHG